MNLPFYIARRYLFSKKSTHVINLISGISAVGVAVATMALVVTLSVFNGFHDLVASFLTAFDPQIEVVPAEGKTAPADDPVLQKIRALPSVDVATESVEDQALAVYRGKQAMVTVKGVDDNFDQLTHINDIPNFIRSKTFHARIKGSKISCRIKSSTIILNHYQIWHRSCITFSFHLNNLGSFTFHQIAFFFEIIKHWFDIRIAITLAFPKIKICIKTAINTLDIIN